jgi:hypothetical protein
MGLVRSCRAPRPACGRVARWLHSSLRLAPAGMPGDMGQFAPSRAESITGTPAPPAGNGTAGGAESPEPGRRTTHVNPSVTRCHAGYWRIPVRGRARVF